MSAWTENLHKTRGVLVTVMGNHGRDVRSGMESKR